jgi:hypothetical protein
MELTYDAITKAVKELRKSKDSVLQRWDYYRNDVARPPYFPYLLEETDDEYQRRTKIAVGWLGAVANRLSSYFCKGPTQYNFKVGGDESHELAVEASELWNCVAFDNAYDTFRVDISRDSGVGGNAYTKERFQLYDGITGKPYVSETTARKWDGRIRIDRVSESYVYRLVDGPRYVYVEAWIRTASGQFKLLSAGYKPQKGDYEYVELIAPAYYDTDTGAVKLPSRRAIWENGELKYDSEIPYTFAPMQRFANMVSRPDVENGISDIEWSIPLVSAINHIMSGIVRSIEYHGWPQIVFPGVDEDSDITRRPERVLFTPESASGNPVIPHILQWDQNVAGALGTTQQLADVMSAISGVPKHVLHDLEGAGKVASGVALTLLYKNMNEACRLKEAGFKAGEEQLVRACLDIIARHNDAPGHFSDVDVSIEYNPDRTPRDIEQEKASDYQELALLLMNEVDYVMKYKGIDEREEAIEYLKTRAEERKVLSALRQGLTEQKEMKDNERQSETPERDEERVPTENEKD